MLRGVRSSDKRDSASEAAIAAVSFVEEMEIVVVTRGGWKLGGGKPGD